MWRKQSNLIQPDWWETTSQNVLAHVDKNTISHIIRQSDDMVDNLFIMRFDLTFNITFMRLNGLGFDIHLVRDLNGSLTCHPHSQHTRFGSAQ